MRRFAVFLAVGSAICGLASAQPGLELIQPDAGIVLGIEWRKILDSPLGATLNEQFEKSSPMPPQMQRLQEIFRHNLDSIIIAASARALAKGTTQPPMLVVVKGRFEASQIREMMKLLSPKIEQYHSVELMSFPDLAAMSSAPAAPNSALAMAPMLRAAILDDATILLGDAGEVRAAIDRAKGGRLTAPRKGILTGAGDLISGNDVWMVLSIPADALKDAPPAAQMMAGIRGLEFGIAFQEGFGIHLNLSGKDANSATSLAQAIQGFVAMAAMSKDQSPETVEMLRKVQIVPDGSRVRVALNLDRNEVQRLIEAAKASRAAPVAKSTAPVRAPEPRGPKSIRITGLDSGPVEMPLAVSHK